MTRLRSVFIGAALLTALPMLSSAEVKITMKNGRDIIADSCREAKGRLVCEMMGGTFDIDKKDVIEMKPVTIYKKEDPSASDGSTPNENTPLIEENVGDQKDYRSHNSEPPSERGSRR